MGSYFSKISNKWTIAGCRSFAEAAMSSPKIYKKELARKTKKKIAFWHITPEHRNDAHKGVDIMSNLLFPDRSFCPSRPGPYQVCYCGEFHKGLCSFFVEGVITFLEKENTKDAYERGLWRANPASEFECHGCPPALTNSQLNSFKKGVAWADDHFQF